MSSFNVCQTSNKCFTHWSLTHYGDTVWGWCLGKFIESVTRALQSILNSRPIKIIIYHSILSFVKILDFGKYSYFVIIFGEWSSVKIPFRIGKILWPVTFSLKSVSFDKFSCNESCLICLFDYYASLLRYYHINLDSSQYTFSKSNNLMHGRNHLLVKNCQKRLSYLWYRMNSLKS